MVYEMALLQISYPAFFSFSRTRAWLRLLALVKLSMCQGVNLLFGLSDELVIMDKTIEAQGLLYPICYFGPGLVFWTHFNFSLVYTFRGELEIGWVERASTFQAKWRGLSYYTVCDRLKSQQNSVWMAKAWSHLWIIQDNSRLSWFRISHLILISGNKHKMFARVTPSLLHAVGSQWVFN